MFVIDTNVLLRVQDEDSPEHEHCVAAVDYLRTNGRQLYTCAQILAEFWVVATRPIEQNGLGRSLDDAIADIADVRDSFACLAEPPDMADRWQQVVIGNKVMGKPAHDARIVALMLAHGVTRILTLNPGDFTRYAGISPVTPEDVIGRQEA